ncbi:unnamed protein product [Debaryomyces fabryi]|nr:unnamed protein product [Debaryomyces fabryi]
MEFKEPLPLIERHEFIHTSDSVDVSESGRGISLATYGYLIIFASWTIFLISMNTLFKIWSFVIYPLSLEPLTIPKHHKLTKFFENMDYYVLSCWCIYVVFWWWSCASWVGLKLFRHSKGILVSS